MLKRLVLEKGVKHTSKKNIRATTRRRSSVFIVNFEQVNVSWVTGIQRSVVRNMIPKNSFRRSGF